MKTQIPKTYLDHFGMAHRSARFQIQSLEEYSSSVMCVCVQLYLTLCDPVDYSLPDSSVHGILQVTILEWVAISFPGDSSWPRDQT